MNTICRLAVCADVPGIYAVEEACFKTPWSLESINTDVCLNKDAYYFVADADGVIVGFCGIHIVIDEGHIMNVAVLSEYRGKGVAASLIRTMMSYTGLDRYTLEVRASNRTAILLYKRLGFYIAGRRTNYYGNEDALIMWRREIPS